MKTAISLSDSLFERIVHHAERLGMSRSEFFAVAAGRYADELDGADLTTAIDDALADAGPDEDAAFVAAATRALFTHDG